MRRLASVPSLAVILAASLTTRAPASAAAPAAWPIPLAAQSHELFDFVHYGEGHHNEDGGPVANGEIFRQTNLYGAAFLAFSSDMATTGTEVQSFEDYIDGGFSPICPKSQFSIPCQTPLQVPWFHSMGNHDREPLVGPGGLLSWENDIYRQVFADNAGPWGEGPVPSGFVGMDRGGESGALTHYWVDYGPVRLIAIDNSCHSITTCDALTIVEQGTGTPVGQHPAESQWDFLRRAAGEATAAGKLVFVFMHEPTRDPRYPLNVATISANHTMNKGVTADNQTFEALAAATGVDGVLLGHIKGNNTYEALGVPYYIDGGGGGRPYLTTSLGTDFGGYYAYRLFRIGAGTIAGRWLIPLVDTFELRLGTQVVTGSITVPKGQRIDLDAIVIQPRCSKPGVCSNQEIRVELRPPRPPAGFESSVPQLAYVWHTSDPGVLAPVGSRVEPGFDTATMSAEGAFDALETGTATVTIVTGWSRAQIQVTVV